MAIIIIAYSILLILLTKYLIKDMLSKFCLYSFILYWGVSLLITCFNPLDMSDVNPITHLILMLAMAGFWGGAYFYSFYIHSYNFPYSTERLQKEAIRISTSKIFIILYVFSSLLLLNYAVRALVMAELNGGTIEYEERLELVFEGSKFAKMYVDFVASPLLYSSFALLGVALMKPNKKFLSFYISSPVFIISYLIIAGGRSIFVIGAMTIAIVIISIRATVNKLNLPKKFFIIGLPVTLVLMLFMAMQTTYRKTGKYELDTDAVGEALMGTAESFFTYSVIPIKMFDYALEHQWPEKWGTFNLGKGTFAGTDYLVCRGMGHITGHYPWSAMDVVNYLQDNRIQVSPHSPIGYNYCYTATFYNYLDFNLFGVFFFPFIFSFLFRHYIIKFQKHKSLPDLLIISFGYFMMLMSLFNCYFIKTWVLIYCVVLVLWSEYMNAEFRHIKFKPLWQWKTLKK